MFTSPPYCSALDYTRAHLFTVAWMPEDMTAVLVEAARVVRRGNPIVMVVCPSNIRKIPILTHRLLSDIARSVAHLEVEDVIERTINERRRLMPYLEAAFGPRMREEYVVVLRRPAT